MDILEGLLSMISYNGDQHECLKSPLIIGIESRKCLRWNKFFISHYSQATDADPPGDNSLLSYGITFSDGTSSAALFTIDSSDGQISASALNYEAVASHMYGLTVTVSDAGTPALSTTCSLTVMIRVSRIIMQCNL